MTRPRSGPGLALVVVLVATIGTALAADGLDFRGVALLVAGGFALVWRHRHPAGTTFAVAAATVAYLTLGYPAGFCFVAPLVAAVAAIRGGREGLAWITGVLAYTAWVLLSRPGLGGALAGGAWLAGTGIVATIATAIAGMVAKMAREQARMHEERQRRQITEERLRIAHELHDVLGHHLSLINIRAGVALHLMDRQPDQVRAALDTIKQTSAEALREVQSVLSTTGDTADRSPEPSLARLDELTGDAGLPVRTEVRGDVRPLPAEVERAAYRIVREALTNVRRHAGPGAAAAVTVDYRAEELVVRIDDDGGAVPEVAYAADGNGVSGMRERTRTLGGSLAAGPGPDGGWRVRAVLPVPAGPPMTAGPPVPPEPPAPPTLPDKSDKSVVSTKDEEDVA